jgi:hypothetical protein
VKAALKNVYSSIDFKNDKADTALSTGNPNVDKQIHDNFAKQIKELQERRKIELMKKPPPSSRQPNNPSAINPEQVDDNVEDIICSDNRDGEKSTPGGAQKQEFAMNKENNCSSTSASSGSPLQQINEKQEDATPKAPPSSARKKIVNPYLKNKKQKDSTPSQQGLAEGNVYKQNEETPIQQRSFQGNPNYQNYEATSQIGGCQDSSHRSFETQNNNGLASIPTNSDGSASKKRSSPNPPEADSAYRRPSSKRQMPWDCQLCTFRNDPRYSLNVCQMCARHRSTR